MYRSVRILSNAKTQPAGSLAKLTHNRPASVLSMKREGQVKVPPKHIRQKKVKKSHQRTITGKMFFKTHFFNYQWQKTVS